MTPDAFMAAVEEAERGPGPNDLDDAPVLTNWYLGIEDGVLLAAGDVTGHPLIAASTLTTSPILALDAEAGWMRTRSRWYRLGPPHDPEGYRRIDPAVQQSLAALRRSVRKHFGGGA